jgi:DNA-directed RNA polymerase specialized sigma subunit
MPEAGGPAEALEWVLSKMAAKLPAPVAPRFQPKPPPKVESVADKQTRLTDTRSKDLELWKTWKENGQKGEHFEDLTKHFSGTLHKRLNTFKGAEVNPTILKSALYRSFWNALDRYDPKHASGANLNTWVNNNLNQLKRVVVYFQNTGRVSEPIANKFGAYDSAVAELTNKLGHEPAIDQIAHHTKFSTKDIINIQQQRRSAHDLEGGGETVESMNLHTSDQVKYAAGLIHPELKPHERKVHELIWPKAGAPVFASGAIAKKLGWEVSKVSKAKKAILEKLLLHM